MIINLKHIFNIVGESMNIGGTVGIDELSALRGCNFSSPVLIKGKCFNRAGVVFLDFSVDFSLHIACDRCLKEFERDYHFDFEHIVVQSSHSSSDEYIIADGESIDLTDIAVSDLLLQIPSKFLCKEDCKGLCMVCGCDLNESDCDCLK